MRRALLILSAFLVLSGFKMFIDGGIVDRWYFDSTSGLGSSSGIDVSISSASPPSVMVATPTSGTEPFFVQPSANDTEVGPYGLYSSPAVDNLAQRAGFESCDGSSHPTGWTVTEIGDGTVDCSTDRKAGGAQSVKLSANTGLANFYSSGCLEVDNSKDYYISAYVYGGATDEKWGMYYLQYSASNCTGFLGANYPENDVDIPSGWSHREKKISSGDWDVSTAGIKMAFRTNAPGSATTVYVDNAQLYQLSNPIDSACICDTDTTCSCSAIIPSIPTKITAGTWQFDGTVRSPVDGAVTTPERYIFYIPATAGNNNKVQFYWSNDLLTLNVWTSTGVLKTATVAAAGNADTSYAVRAYHTDTGRIGVCWDGTCGTETTGALLGTPSATTYIGSTDTVGSNVWVDDITWSRKLLEAP